MQFMWLRESHVVSEAASLKKSFPLLRSKKQPGGLTLLLRNPAAFIGALLAYNFTTANASVKPGSLWHCERVKALPLGQWPAVNMNKVKASHLPAELRNVPLLHPPFEL
jgi:hypothetical protein